MSYDIITFGSAAQDIHVKSKSFKVIKDEKNFTTGEGICLALGSKIDVEDVVFTSGGGGTNTAATFAKQGLHVAFCGAIGADAPGLDIVRELKHLKIDTRFIVKKKEKYTNNSIIISTTGRDRTILVYRGASDVLTGEDILWKKIKKTKWFYLAPISGKLLESAEEIVRFAKENGIKVAANPSQQQLALASGRLKNFFKNIDVLFLNKEEASFLAGIPYTDEDGIFKKIDEICSGVAVMTKGRDGVVVSDGEYLYSALPHQDRQVVDSTGAGDAFASGFLSGFIKGRGDVERAIQLGIANSEGVLSDIGAKNGLLAKDAEFDAVSVQKQLCAENNLCIKK